MNLELGTFLLSLYSCLYQTTKVTIIFLKFQEGNCEHFNCSDIYLEDYCDNVLSNSIAHYLSDSKMTNVIHVILMAQDIILKISKQRVSEFDCHHNRSKITVDTVRII